MAISKTVWRNFRKPFRGQNCKATYTTTKGARKFKLVDKTKKVTHTFKSHEAAKAEGWRPRA